MEELWVSSIFQALVEKVRKIAQEKAPDEGGGGWMRCWGRFLTSAKAVACDDLSFFWDW